MRLHSGKDVQSAYMKKWKIWRMCKLTQLGLIAYVLHKQLGEDLTKLRWILLSSLGVETATRGFPMTGGNVFRCVLALPTMII